MRVVPLVLTLALFASGCAGSPDPGAGLEQAEAASTIVVEDGEGGTVAVNVTNETGAVVGQVLSDSGFGLPDARVTVIGADHGATTNQTGWFQIEQVPRGERLLRAEHQNYRAAENTVHIEAQRAIRVTITLVPAVDGEAGYRPHMHDYWSGQDRIVVADSTREWYRQTVAGPHGTTLKLLNIAVGSAYGTNCVGPGGDDVQGSASPLRFDESTQLVIPGTSALEVTLSWTVTDYPGVETVGLAWRPPNSTTFAWSPPIKNGAMFRIPVEPPMWDYSHQPFSLWEVYVCLAGKGEGVATSSTSQITPGRAFVGRYHAKIDLVRGHPIFADPPHPRFWQNGSIIQVLDGEAVATCAGAPTDCYGQVLGIDRARAPSPFVFQPAEGVLVPPGARRLYINLSWTYSTDVENRPLGLALSPAAIAPHDKEDAAKYRVVQPTERTSTSRFYEVPVEPGDHDGFYQKRSNWQFLWGYEGDETNPSFVHWCGCDIKVALNVAATSQ